MRTVVYASSIFHSNLLHSGDALFDCIQSFLMNVGMEPLVGPVRMYWLATLFLRLPSVDVALRTAVTEIAIHSLHSAERCAALIPCVVNSIVELNTFLTTDPHFSSFYGETEVEAGVDLLTILKDRVVALVGGNLRLETLIAVYNAADFTSRKRGVEV